LEWTFSDAINKERIMNQFYLIATEMVHSIELDFRNKLSTFHNQTRKKVQIIIKEICSGI
jgi:hypothetical protein